MPVLSVAVFASLSTRHKCGRNNDTITIVYRYLMTISISRVIIVSEINYSMN